MVFKKLQPPVRIIAYEGKKVTEKDLLIDDNGYMWQTNNSWRVTEYKNCGTADCCKYKGKGKLFEVSEDLEPHLYNLTRALDEIRETSPCAPQRIDCCAYLKHFKHIIDKAFVVAQFGEMDRVNLELNLPIGKFTLENGVLSCSSMTSSLKYLEYFCEAVTAIDDR